MSFEDARSAFHRVGKFYEGKGTVDDLQELYRTGHRLGKRLGDYVYPPNKKQRITSKMSGKGSRGLYTYAGKFRGGRKFVGNKNRKYGFEVVEERGGLVGDAEAVAIAHGVAVGRLMEAACHALWRQLWKKCGFEVVNWKGEPFPMDSGSFLVKYIYRDNYLDTAGSATRTITLAANLNHHGIAQAIHDDFMNVVGSTSETFILQMIWVEGTGGTHIGQLNCIGIKLSMSQKSVLILQNRTPGAAADDTLVTDVTNNPLVGRSWLSSGSFARTRNQAYYLGAAGVSYTDVASGISLLAKDGTYSGQALNNTLGGGAMDKIASASAFKAISSASVMLNPGQIKKDIVNMNMTMTMNKLFHKLRVYITNESSTSKFSARPECFIGKNKLFQFEKLCDTDTVGHRDISLGFEINVITSARVLGGSFTATPRFEVHS